MRHINGCYDRYEPDKLLGVTFDPPPIYAFVITVVVTNASGPRRHAERAPSMTYRIYFAICAMSFFLTACGEDELSIDVIATAYTSSHGETDDTPTLAAWGDTLEPGMKAIAVSRDLIATGIEYKSEVRISGLEGRYLVLDKMNKRWERKIDIYMGNDKDRARAWGEKKITIYWRP